MDAVCVKVSARCAEKTEMFWNAGMFLFKYMMENYATPFCMMLKMPMNGRLLQYRRSVRQGLSSRQAAVEKKTEYRSCGRQPEHKMECGLTGKRQVSSKS